MEYLNEQLLDTYPLLFIVDVFIYITVLINLLFVILELLFNEDYSFTSYHLATSYMLVFCIGYIMTRILF